jgi:hypothetical protein
MVLASKAVAAVVGLVTLIPAAGQAATLAVTIRVRSGTPPAVAMFVAAHRRGASG